MHPQTWQSLVLTMLVVVLIADVTGMPYPVAVGCLVLEPPGMGDASFPERWPPDALTAYRAAPEGAFEPEPPRICTLPAAGDLWAGAADLVRFCPGWSALLPPDLARDALRPQAPAGERNHGARGLGWLIDPRAAVVGSSGAGPGVSTSLLLDRVSGQAFVAFANR